MMRIALPANATRQNAPFPVDGKESELDTNTDTNTDTKTSKDEL